MIGELPRNDPDYTQDANPTLATASWLDSASIVALYQTQLTGDDAGNDILLGRLEDDDKNNYYIGYKDDRHLITGAGTRGGKNVAQVITNLLHYKHNVVVLDPKGENANNSAHFRSEVLGHNVAVFDPYHICDASLDKFRVSFNPLSKLDPDDPEIVEKTTALADAITIQHKHAKDSHFDDNCKFLLRALMLFALIHPREGEPRAPTFFDVLQYLDEGVIDPEEEEKILDAQNKEDIPELLAAEPKSFENLIKTFQGIAEFQGAIRSVGYAIARMGEREFGSVNSTVRRNIDFLLTENMVNILSDSNFHPEDLRDPKKPTSAYLVLPEFYFNSQARWLRLMLTTFFHELQRNEIGENGKPKTETLFILDEFSSLGYLELVESAAGYIAGFGVKLWVILQDLNQLKDLYKTRFETFIGNAGCVLGFANTDNTTLEYFSKRLGETEIVRTETTKTTGGGLNTSKVGFGGVMKEVISDKGEATSILGASQLSDNSSHSETEAPKHQTTPLMRPDEIARYFRRKPKDERDSEMLLCLLAGEPPMRLQKVFYYNDPILRERSKQH